MSEKSQKRSAPSQDSPPEYYDCRPREPHVELGDSELAGDETA